jgi:hypothetical protein
MHHSSEMNMDTSDDNFDKTRQNSDDSVDTPNSSTTAAAAKMKGSDGHWQQEQHQNHQQQKQLQTDDNDEEDATFYDIISDTDDDFYKHDKSAEGSANTTHKHNIGGASGGRRRLHDTEESLRLSDLVHTQRESSAPAALLVPNMDTDQQVQAGADDTTTPAADGIPTEIMAEHKKKEDEEKARRECDKQTAWTWSDLVMVDGAGADSIATDNDKVLYYRAGARTILPAVTRAKGEDLTNCETITYKASANGNVFLDVTYTGPITTTNKEGLRFPYTKTGAAHKYITKYSHPLQEEMSQTVFDTLVRVDDNAGHIMEDEYNDVKDYAYLHLERWNLNKANIRSAPIDVDADRAINIAMRTFNAADIIHMGEIAAGKVACAGFIEVIDQDGAVQHLHMPKTALKNNSSFGGGDIDYADVRITYTAYKCNGGNHVIPVDKQYNVWSQERLDAISGGLHTVTYNGMVQPDPRYANPIDNKDLCNSKWVPLVLRKAIKSVQISKNVTANDDNNVEQEMRVYNEAKWRLWNCEKLSEWLNMENAYCMAIENPTILGVGNALPTGPPPAPPSSFGGQAPDGPPAAGPPAGPPAPPPPLLGKAYAPKKPELTYVSLETLVLFHLSVEEATILFELSDIYDETQTKLASPEVELHILNLQGVRIDKRRNPEEQARIDAVIKIDANNQWMNRVNSTISDMTRSDTVQAILTSGASVLGKFDITEYSIRMLMYIAHHNMSMCAHKVDKDQKTATESGRKYTRPDPKLCASITSNKATCPELHNPKCIGRVMFLPNRNALVSINASQLILHGLRDGFPSGSIAQFIYTNQQLMKPADVPPINQNEMRACIVLCSWFKSNSLLFSNVVSIIDTRLVQFYILYRHAYRVAAGMPLLPSRRPEHISALFKFVVMTMSIAQGEEVDKDLVKYAKHRLVELSKLQADDANVDVVKSSPVVSDILLTNRIESLKKTPTPKPAQEKPPRADIAKNVNSKFYNHSNVAVHDNAAEILAKIKYANRSDDDDRGSE